MKRAFTRAGTLAATQAEAVGRDRRNVDICLAAALAEPGLLGKIRHPAAYVDLLRSSIEPMACAVREIRNTGTESDSASRRFATLTDTLASDVPPIPMATAQAIALVADGYRDLPGVVDYDLGR